MKEYRAGIYLRLSKEHPEENNSIEAQREITTNYANKNGYKIVKKYIDNGYSGILDSRPGLNEMMVDIARGFINMVIVKDISRLTRNKNKTGWYTEIFFPDNDVRFISVTEFIDSGDRYEIDDTIMLRGIANQCYISDISKKVRANKSAMKENGQYVEYAVPYGYKKSEEDKHKIIIDEKVADYIKIIFKMYLEGNTGVQIAKYLNNKKIKNPSRYLNMRNASNKWTPETVNDILSNPFYAGNTVMNKYITDYLKKTCKKNRKRETWIIKENTHDAIITKGQYDKVQEIKNSRHVKKKEKHEYLLKGLLFCGCCKNRYQYKVYKSKNKYLYESSGFVCGIVYKNQEKCKNKTFIKEKDLNKIVIDEMKKKFSKLKTDEQIAKIIDKNKTQNYLVKELETYKNEIKKLERRKRVLYKKKCDKYITETDFKEKYESIKKEIGICEYKFNKLKEESKSRLDVKRIKNIILELKSGKNIDNKLLKEIISKIEIYPNNKIEITFKL